MRVVCPRDCYDTCSLIVRVENGRIKKIMGDPKHPITRGVTCPRAFGDVKRVYTNRVLYPHILVGSKLKGEFKRCSWSKALKVIALNLEATIKNYGSEAVLHIEYAGNMGLITWYYTKRFWNVIGAASTDYSICSSTGHEAIALHYGLSYGVLPEDIPKMRLVVFWGSNPAVSGVHLWRLAILGKYKNNTLVACVDPRRSETARTSDLHLQPIPGTDAILAYGVANYLIENCLVDYEFIEQYTYGYEYFKREASKWSLDRVEELTKVPKNDIVELAEAYGKLQPSLTFIGLGLSRSIVGSESVRIISLIPALLGLHRGFYYSNSKGWSIDLAYLTGESLGYKGKKVVSMVKLGEHLKRGDFKFVYIYNMNPIESLPNTRELIEGLLRDDVFVVVHDTHWSTTTSYANIVLPAPTYLEKDDIPVSYSHSLVAFSKRVIEPLGESMPEHLVLQEIAKILKVESEILHEDPIEALEKAFKNAFEKGDFKALFKGGFLKLKQKPKKYYPTPTGKIEFYSLKARELGLNPLPQPLHVKVRDGEFILLNCAHPKYTNSQFREVYGDISPILMVNSKDARRYELKSGDIVAVYNDRGEVHLKVKVTDDIPPKTLWTYRMVRGVNGELLNSIMPPKAQEVGGSPTINSTIVKIKKVTSR